jgi:hypothetical protein
LFDISHFFTSHDISGYILSNPPKKSNYDIQLFFEGSIGGESGIWRLLIIPFIRKVNPITSDGRRSGFPSIIQ